MKWCEAAVFEQGVRPPEVARRLRVSRKSAYAWHAAWRQGGRTALVSKGAGGFPCQLSDDQLELQAFGLVITELLRCGHRSGDGP
ncbi:helix-turn-helix domain-containing protein [Streptomyces sp. NPDC051921]|uniref:helix-turn-helix domain-containing protein n=1 Tax=Streptomyces sp. NPDC051921 TaxID=3155806 RepID=UPI00341EB689